MVQYHPNSCSHVSTIVWLHHLDLNEMPEEKTRWESHKDTVYHFEQVLEATLYKTPVVWQLTSHLANHPRQAKPLLEKLRQTH